MLTGLRFLFAAFPALLFVPPPEAPATLVAAFGLTLGVVQIGTAVQRDRDGDARRARRARAPDQVFLTVALSAALFPERPRPLQLIGAALGIGGIIVIARWRIGGAAALPFAMVIGAATAWSCANLIAKRAGRVNMLSFMVWASLAAPLPLFALSWMLEDRAASIAALSHPALRSVLAVAFLTYPTTLVAFSLWNRLLSRHTAASVTPLALLVPVVGLASTHFVFGEPVGATELVGGLLVLGGLVLNSMADRPRAPVG